MGGHRYVVCFNPKEAERQRLHRGEVLQELTEELRSLKEHPKRACRLMASRRRFGRNLRRLKSGELRLNQAVVQEQERHDEIWIIYSNDDELSAEDLALAYKQLLRVEECWRTMNSTIEIPPVFHRSPHGSGPMCFSVFCLFFWNEWRKRSAGRPSFGSGRNFVP